MRTSAKSSSITGRWLSSIFSIIVIALIVVEIVVIFLTTSSIDTSVSDYMTAQSEMVCRYFSEYIKTNGYDFGLAAGQVLSIVGDSSPVRIEIYSADGNPVVTSSGFCFEKQISVSGSTITRRYRDPETGEFLIVHTAPLTDSFGTVFGCVRLISSLRRVNLQKTLSVILSLVLGGGVLGLVALSGSYFVSSIVNPIKQIAATATVISKGDFTTRILTENHDEIGELAVSINNMAADLSKLDQMKNDFISSVSHELRTPLTAIKGWNETLMACDPVQDEETIRMGLEVIASESDRLANMVEELLDYSKIQSGKITMNYERLDLSALLTATVIMFKEKALQRRIVLVYSEPGIRMEIDGDPYRLKQVLVNIIDNAIKHSFDDSRIEIYAETIDGGYSVTVRDYGEGIRAEDLPHIKKRFYKGKSKAPGSGLGLAISDSVITLHGGYLDINSEEGRGTSVIISLPQKLPKKFRKPKTEQSENPQNSASKERI